MLQTVAWSVSRLVDTWRQLVSKKTCFKTVEYAAKRHAVKPGVENIKLEKWHRIAPAALHNKQLAGGYFSRCRLVR